jgi:hypothetical protein
MGTVMVEVADAVAEAVPFPTEDVAEPDGAAEPDGIAELSEGVAEPDAQEGAVFTLTFWSLHNCWASWVIAVE